MARFQKKSLIGFTLKMKSKSVVASTLRKAEAAEKLHISRQLDKTERVLKTALPPIACGLSPKNLKDNTNQNLNADIAQQNMMLVLDTTSITSRE
ncbi:MAG: hypothetical protein U0T81_10315 [Saprospiraceae bacterium]